MRILIIAKFWNSSAGIGALRPMKIAQYLIAAGHEVAVICGEAYANQNGELNCLQLPAFSYTGIVAKEDAFYQRRNQGPVVVGKNGSPKRSDKPGVASKRTLFNRFKWYLYRTIYNSIKIRNTVQYSWKKIRKDIPWIPDVIFSSYAPEEVHFLAMKLKKRYPQAYWIADFRDPMANRLAQTWREYQYKLRRQKYIFRKADAVTIVSQTWRDEFESQGARNCITLYSGFDAQDFCNLEQVERTDKLTFTYTGSLYPGLSDLRPFFKAISHLIETGEIAAEQIRIVYAGAHREEFDQQADVLNGQVELVNHGLVSRKESLRLLMQSDILLHALFCYPETRGIITGKLGEYWASHKPILAVVTGNARADEFISILQASGTGMAYDETNHTASFEAMNQYILQQYNRKQHQMDLLYERNDVFIQQFDYAEIVKRLCFILNENGVST